MKKIREQQDEERRKAIDVEEEKLAAERRREHIEKAKQLQYYETDRVRTFHVKISSNNGIDFIVNLLECIGIDRSVKRTRSSIRNEEEN